MYGKKKLFLIIILLSIVLSSCTKNKSNIIYGTKIYNYEGDYDLLFKKWNEIKINTVFVSQELAYNSEFRKLVKKHNIKMFVIFPVFYNPELLQNDSSYYAITNIGTKAKLDWLEFVCPSRKLYREKLLKSFEKMITQTDPDGVSIDFIRHFLYWEMIKPTFQVDSIIHGCYCDSCLNQFEINTGKVLPKSSGDLKISEILAHNKDWIYFRNNQITILVNELAKCARLCKPDIIINLHAVPWRSYDYENARYNLAGQDIEKLSEFVDYISPMCYSWMLYREPDWVGSVVEDFNLSAQGKILPSIEVNGYYRHGILTASEFEQNLHNALKKPSRGVIFWEWNHIENDSSKYQILLKNTLEY